MNKKNKSILLAGPWVGEFGWELFNWQGYIRHLSTKFDKTIISCRKTSAYLYEDFCNDFIFIKSIGDPDMNRCYGPIFGFNKPEKFDHWENPENLKYDIVKSVPIVNLKSQKFVDYGIKLDEYENSIVIHARSTNKCKTGYRDWSVENWNELVKYLIEMGETVISIGLKQTSLHIENTVNKINYNLSTTCNILKSSKLIIGPSSGPMHLASLCKTPQIVWSGDYKNKYRYENIWNPFNTKVIYEHENNWNPSPNRIKKLYENFICSSF